MQDQIQDQTVKFLGSYINPCFIKHSRVYFIIIRFIISQRVLPSYNLINEILGEPNLGYFLACVLIRAQEPVNTSTCEECSRAYLYDHRPKSNERLMNVPVKSEVLGFISTL